MDDEPIISLHDPHGIVVWINKAPEGVQPEEVIGTAPWQWVPEEDRLRIKAHFATCIAMGDRQHFESPAVVNGKRIQLEVRIDQTGGTIIPVIARTRVLDSRVSLLTNREKEVAKLTAQGLSAKQIGRKLGIAASTVDTHRTRIRAKLALRTIADVALFAMRNLHD